MVGLPFSQREALTWLVTEGARAPGKGSAQAKGGVELGTNRSVAPRQVTRHKSQGVLGICAANEAGERREQSNHVGEAQEEVTSPQGAREEFQVQC